MQLGESAISATEITVKDIFAFADLTGDRNPIHLDVEEAKKVGFEDQVAHGMLVASSISKLIASDLPGEGSIYLSQTLEFRAPVYPGSIVRTTVTVLSKKTVRAGKIYWLSTQCFVDDKTVIDGKAEVLKRDVSN